MTVKEKKVGRLWSRYGRKRVAVTLLHTGVISLLGTGIAFSIGRCAGRSDVSELQRHRSALAGVGTSVAADVVLDASPLGKFEHDKSMVDMLRPNAPQHRLGDRRPGLQPVLSMQNDTLDLTWPMVVLTAGATVLTAGVIFRAARAAPLLAFVAVGMGALIADLLSGIIHWATDNYGTSSTPIVGSACAAFQGHHLAPWTITFRPFANNVYKIARLLLVFTGVAVLSTPPILTSFFATVFYGQVLCQEFHRWAHIPLSRLHPLQRWLQRSGFAISSAKHGGHHKPPFADTYCLLSGVFNPWIDRKPIYLWRRLEVFVYWAMGVEPNCWKGVKGAPVRQFALSL